MKVTESTTHFQFAPYRKDMNKNEDLHSRFAPINCFGIAQHRDYKLFMRWLH